MGDNLPAINLGTGVVPAHLAVADGHACVLTVAGGVKCFGNNTYGQSGSNLGNGSPAGANDCTVALNCIGDDPSEMGDNLAYAVSAGGATELTVGYRQSCAVLIGASSLKCWGNEHLRPDRNRATMRSRRTISAMQRAKWRTPH